MTLKQSYWKNYGKLIKCFSLENMSSSTDATLRIHAFTGFYIASTFSRKRKVNPVSSSQKWSVYHILCNTSNWVDSQWKLTKEMNNFVCAEFCIDCLSEGVKKLGWL